MVPLTTDSAFPAAERGIADHSGLRLLRSRGRIRGVVALLGPAFVAAVAYVDPGNFATNFSIGAQFGYGLAWVVALANLMAMMVQYLSAKVGVATGRDLPELCRDLFPRGGDGGGMPGTYTPSSLLQVPAVTVKHLPRFARHRIPPWPERRGFLQRSR